jgi:predicted NBD/HSP70 family sugar kinase
MNILFDIGATTSRFASSKDGKTLSQIISKPTPQNLDEAISLYTKLVADLSGGEKIEHLAGGLPGPFNLERSGANPPHLPNWIGKKLVEKFFKIAECPVFFENDAALAGLGEATKGSGAGFGIVGYLAIGTGIGGVRIVNRQIDANSLGFEPGHMLIAPGKNWESFNSGSAIKARYGKQASEMVNPAFWQEFQEYLVLALNNVIVMWSPDLIILGGGVVLGGQISIDRIMLELYKILRIYPKLPKVTKSSFGDNSTLEGALIYLNQKIGNRKE